MRLHHLLLGLTLAANLIATQAYAQWDIEDSHTTASLRGIHNVGGGVAWASGTNGTVLRTEDGGYLWQTCTIPPGAEKLDFRGIQAFDENTAIVMSSGTGDLSRLYKTTDGCQTWKLLFTNPDKEGFWDAIVVKGPSITILGDPVNNRFVLWDSSDGGKNWSRTKTESSNPDEGVFAASNSSLFINSDDGISAFGTGGPAGSRLFYECDPCTKKDDFWAAHKMPFFPSSKSAGIFALGSRDWEHWTAVGGDYLKPQVSSNTAAYTSDQGLTWQPATTTPHGFRSAVAYDAEQKLWITVGPNGTDISTDDGKNWRPLTPSPQDPPDADKNWNALSLPFVVGPHGRIGRLRTIDTPKK